MSGLPRRRIEFFQGVADGEAGRLLTRWELFESLQELSDISLRWYQQVCMVQPPIPVSVRGESGSLIRIRSQIEKPGWRTQPAQIERIL